MPDDKAKKWYKRALMVGAAFGVLCHLLPPDYRAVCDLVTSICRGGF